MTDAKDKVAQMIRDAFRDVTLGDGVGLWEGQGLDDYADAKTMQEYQAKDEQNNWSQIPVSELNRCHSSLSFFDAEGMRFHLPAYLIAHLKGTLHQDVIFHLIYFGHDAMSRFALLDKSQRNAVCAFLTLHLTDKDYAFERQKIQKAIDQFWKDSDQSP